MTSRAHAYVVAGLLGILATLLTPQLGTASSGGASLSGSSGGTGSSGSSGSQTTSAGTVQPANQTVSASGSGMTIVTRANAMLRNQLRFSGTVSGSAAGHIIEIERLGRQTNWAWARTTHGRVRSDGSFSVTWTTNHIGRFSIRAVVLGKRAPRTAASSPSLTVTVYRPAIATIYGPGFWGQRTACGQKLTRHMLGTANRTLKCGTRVAIEYHGHTIVVPVIDRGPYANGADWDLTEATAQAIGMNGTARIGAVSIPSH